MAGWGISWALGPWALGPQALVALKCMYSHISYIIEFESGTDAVFTMFTAFPFKLSNLKLK